MLIATCPRCRASYQVADHLKGKKIRCRKCQQVFPVRPAAELEEAWEPVDEDERDPARAGKEKASSQANRSGRSRRARGEEEVEERAPGPRKPPRPEAPRKPKEVLRAIFLLVGVGAFETAIPLFLGTVMLTRGDKPTDEFGGMLLAGITVFLLGKGATAFTSAVLLARHRPLGRVLAWVIAILCFPGFPVFTVISLALMSALHSRGMRDYFAADREEEAPVYAPGLPRGEKRSGGLSDQVRPSPRWWVVLGVCAGVLVLALAGLGIWKWRSHPRKAEVVQTPAVRISFPAAGTVIQNILLGGPGSNQVAIQVGGVNSQEVPFLERYDATTKKLLGHTQLVGLSLSQQMALSPGGAYLAVAQWSNPRDVLHWTITTWSLADGKVLKAGWNPFSGGEFPPSLSWISFLDDRRLLILTGDGQLSGWDLQGQALYSVRPGFLKGAVSFQNDISTRMPQNYALSADHQSLALFNGDGFTLLDTSTGNPKTQTTALAGPGTEVHGAALDRNAGRLAVCLAKAGKEELSIWDFSTKQQTGPFPIHCKAQTGTSTTDWTSSALEWWDAEHLLLWNRKASALVLEVGSGKVVRQLVTPLEPSMVEVDAEDRLWYVARTWTEMQIWLCAVNLPSEDLRQYTGLEGNNYPLWVLTPNGVETQAQAKTVGIFPRARPGG